MISPTPSKSEAEVKKGFTLIEVLVVIAIILVLAGLVIGTAFPAVQRAALKNETERRLNNLLTSLEMYRPAHGNRVERLFYAVTSYDLRLAPLRQVFAAVAQYHPTGMQGLLGDDTAARFPPHLVNRAYVRKNHSSQVDNTSVWRMPGRGIDHHLIFVNRTYQNGSFIDRFDFSSHNSESLDTTLEVIPVDGVVWSETEYLSRWPNMTESFIQDSDPLEYEQSSWSWVSGGTPILGMPWGERIISRNPDLGRQVNFIAPMGLAKSNPMVTPVLLECTDLFLAAIDSLDSWRTDRNPRKLWNDSWGNPLVMGAIAYHAPRYDFDDANEKMVYGPSNTVRNLTSRELHGGRDWLFQMARKTYGFARGVYVSAGALGPGLNYTETDLIWEEKDDETVLRAIWKFIGDRCQMSDWDERSFSERPVSPSGHVWHSVRVYPDFTDSTSDRRDPTFLTAPRLIR